MTKLEHKDVVKALLKGLPDHANDSDEVNNNIYFFHEMNFYLVA